jgi:uncharacterized protein
LLYIHDARRATMAGMPDLQLRTPANRASARARMYWTLRALPAWLLAGGVESAVLLGSGATESVAGPVAGVTILVALAHLVLMPQWRFRVHRWEITDTAVYTQAGWLRQERRIAPIARVQTVDTRRGPIEAIFGLVNVTVTTASAQGPLRIHALDRPVAEQVVEQLTERAQLAIGDGT